MSGPVEIAALHLTTREGCSLAVGGICLPGTGPRWEREFARLGELSLLDKDLYTLDYTVAQALGDMSDRSLLIAGCSVKAGLALAPGMSTGGVLGSPRESIQSSPGGSEELPHGFSLYTAPGGPGLAALASREITAQAARELSALGPNPTREDILRCLEANQIHTYLLVRDGTGPGARGCVAAGNRGTSVVLFLDELLPNLSHNVKNATSTTC